MIQSSGHDQNSSLLRIARIWSIVNIRVNGESVTVESLYFSRNFVPSGRFKVSGAKPEILEAYLGTCVGVTLCDPHSNVGGLIHLLLPEPTNKENLWQPEMYALTGLPLFVRSLCEAGAIKEKLVACVAGGALVAPLSRIDLNLDIGGRTLEVVETYLNREKIPVIKSETGGFFSCRLSLSLKTWQTIIEPLSSHHKKSRTNQSRQTNSTELDEAVESVRPIPQIVLKLIRMLESDGPSLRDLSKEIHKDQVLSAKVIRLCNSAFISPKNKIDSIERAIVLLGEEQLLRMVLATSLGDFIFQEGQNYSVCKGVLYQHAIGTAMLSQKLSLVTGEVNPDVAYTAGLLHDIGKVVLDHYPHNPHFDLYRRLQSVGGDLSEREKDLFGFCHTEAGERLAHYWRLPESLIEAIRFHHDPDRASVDVPLVHLIHLADSLISGLMVGTGLGGKSVQEPILMSARPGLHTDTLVALVEDISNQIFYTCS